MYTLLLHVANEEPIKVDVDELPDPRDVAIVGRNPRLRGDKEVVFLEEGVNTVIFPWWRINYIQVLPGPEDDLDFPTQFRD